MEVSTVLLWVECAIHFATFLVLFVYKDGEARQRWGVSCLAIGIAGVSIGLAVLIVTGMVKPGYPLVQALYVAGFACVLGLVIRARGNVAKVLAPIKPRVAH